MRKSRKRYIDPDFRVARTGGKKVTTKLISNERERAQDLKITARMKV